MKHIERLKKTNSQKLQETIIDIEQIRKLILNNQIFLHQCKIKGVDFSLIESLIDLLKYRLFIGILFADFCSSLNIYFKAQTLYEEKFALRSLLIVINEGVKKIYNFENINSEGYINQKERNNSFWMKEVKPIVQSEARGFSEHYDAITQKLDEFLLHDFNRIKIDRNLSIHYDKNPMLLYKMIINLDLDEKLPLILDFMKVIDEMFHFTEILGKHLYENFDDIIDKIHR